MVKKKNRKNLHQKTDVKMTNVDKIWAIKNGVSLDMTGFDTVR